MLIKGGMKILPIKEYSLRNIFWMPAYFMFVAICCHAENVSICILECLLIITLHVLFVCECILTKPMKLLLYLCPLSVNYLLTFGVQTNCQRYSRLCMYYRNIKVDKYILYFLTCGCHLFTILNTKVSLILWRENNIYGISNGEGK